MVIPERGKVCVYVLCTEAVLFAGLERTVTVNIQSADNLLKCNVLSLIKRR